MTKEAVPEGEWKLAFANAAAAQIAGDLEKAEAIYRALAERGDAWSQHTLAYLLDNEVIPRRTIEAVYWYERAIGRGLATSAWNLAMRYRLQGKRRWYVHWLRVAAELGEEDAAADLQALPALGAEWWKLENVRDPPGSASEFRTNVVLLKGTPER